MTLSVINHDIQALNVFEKTKETDLGIRITRHLKMLRRTATFSHLKAVWGDIMQEAAIVSVENATSHLDEQTFTFDKNVPVSKPAKIYVLALTTVLCLREKNVNEVPKVSIGRPTLLETDRGG
jgi:hypothetical protein